MGLITLFNRNIDDFVERSFQRGEQGGELYFPLWMGSLGRVVPNAASSARVRVLLRRGLIVLSVVTPLLVSYVMQSSMGWTGLALIYLPMLPWFLFKLIIARGLETSGQRMTIANQASALVDRYSFRRLRFNAAASAMMAGLGVLLFVSAGGRPGEPVWMKPLMGYSAVFFAVGAATWAWLASKKRARDGV
jgi:hypothetical protein